MPPVVGPTAQLLSDLPQRIAEMLKVGRPDPASFATIVAPVDGMTFQAAYSYLKHGHRIKLPEWGGYWSWDADKRTIMLHTRKDDDLDIRETKDVDYTMGFLFRTDWMLADEQEGNPDPAPGAAPAAA